MLAGPPPRMRGRLTQAPHLVPFAGTTPAHAGKTGYPATLASAIRDHPGACGEDWWPCPSIPRVWGPPPRMRGRQSGQIIHRSRLGTTPAHAGKTTSTWPRANATRDHPRACGEDCDFAFEDVELAGPPPRMRGRLVETSRTGQVHGTTPAHAGKTHISRSATFSLWDHPRACGEDFRSV